MNANRRWSATAAEDLVSSGRQPVRQTGRIWRHFSDGALIAAVEHLREVLEMLPEDGEPQFDAEFAANQALTV